jgi:hypothetical protein
MIIAITAKRIRRVQTDSVIDTVQIQNAYRYRLLYTRLRDVLGRIKKKKVRR